jgi:oligopeptidase B
MIPPKANKVAHEVGNFNDTRTDDYFYLKDKENPEVIKLLEAENNYYSCETEHLKDLTNQIYEEILSHIVEDIRSVPIKIKQWVYITRYEKGFQYPVFTRKPYLNEASLRIPSPGEKLDEDETILLDVNRVAKDFEYFGLGDFQISIDTHLLAFSYDTDGSEIYDINILDLNDYDDQTNKQIDFLTATSGTIVWHKDNIHLYYLKLDSQMRPYQVWCHELLKQQTEDTLIYEELDGAFFVDVTSTKDDNFVLITSKSKITSEVRIIDANLGFTQSTVFVERQTGHEYQIEHLNSVFYIVTNLNAINFKVMTCDISNTQVENWKELIAHSDNVRVEDLEVFKNHIVVSKRSNANTFFEVLTIDNGTRYEFFGTEPFCSTYFNINPDIGTNILRFTSQSLKTPDTISELNLDTKKVKNLWQRPYNNFKSDDYVTNRAYGKSKDGTAIPYTFIYKKDFSNSEPKARPCLLYAYGAYEISLDPWFSPSRLSLLDRGFVFVIAHVRGGGENGRLWYENGKKQNKLNTFYDVISVANDLISKKITNPELLAIRGGSAGGLTVGAVINMAPDMFQVAVAEVPFVDTLTTMCDKSLPLTITEWDEWGNPLDDEQEYFYIKKYSPYDNINAEVIYPKLLVTAGLNDPRVGFQEPTKWTQKLREANNSNKVLLKVEMGAGHQGPSGRYKEFEQEAEILAFIVSSIADDYQNI